MDNIVGADGNKLFIGNLDWNVTVEELKKAFEQVGKVVDAIILRDRNTGKSRGFGFITMASAEERNRALDSMRNFMLNGRAIKVIPALPRQKKREYPPTY